MGFLFDNYTIGVSNMRYSNNELLDEKVRAAYRLVLESQSPILNNGLSRRAILIRGYSDDSDLAICNLWREFLMEDFAGGWSESEIYQFDKIDNISDFCSSFDDVTSKSDYNIVVFTGDEIPATCELPWEVTKLKVPGLEPFPIHALNPKSTRGGLIILNTYKLSENADNESCHESTEPPVESPDTTHSPAYNNAILNCEKGIISVYSGGYQNLSRDLLELAEKNWETSKNRTMSIRELWELYEKAYPNDKLCSSYHQGRRLNAFPITTRL